MSAAFRRAISFCSPWTRIWGETVGFDAGMPFSSNRLLSLILPRAVVWEPWWIRWSAGSQCGLRRRCSPLTSSAAASGLTWLWSPPALTWCAGRSKRKSTTAQSRKKHNFLHFLSGPDLCQGSLYAVAGNDHSVPLVSAPALKELSGEAALHHPRRRHHHARTDVIKVIHALGEATQWWRWLEQRSGWLWGAAAHLQIADVLEDKGVVDVDGLAYLVVHGVDVGLVHSHAFLGQGWGVVDGDVMQLWVVLPVLVCRSDWESGAMWTEHLKIGSRAGSYLSLEFQRHMTLYPR